MKFQLLLLLGVILLFSVLATEQLENPQENLSQGEKKQELLKVFFPFELN